MATSGSTDWSLTAGDVLTRAYRLLGLIGQSDTVPGELSTTGLAVLNGFVKSLRQRGVMLHALFQDSFTVTSATASYTLSPRVLSLSNVRYRPSGGYDTPLYELSRSEYLDMPNKTSSGRPSQFYLDQQRGVSTLYLWPVPDNSTGAIHYSAERILEDLDLTTNDFDFQPEQQHMLVWGLAAELAPEFCDLGSPRIQGIMARAGGLLEDAIDASRPAFFSIVPDC
jgi:hypothetical protein